MDGPRANPSKFPLAHSLEWVHTLSGTINELVSQAYLDSVTQIYNKWAFDGFSNALASVTPSKPAVVAFIDLTDFKNINSKITHEGGNAALALIGQKLLSFSNEHEDINPFRYGGDEFVLVMPSGVSQPFAEWATDNLCHNELTWNKAKISFECNVGWCASEGELVRALRDRAEMACGWAKAKGILIPVEWKKEFGEAFLPQRRKKCPKCETRTSASIPTHSVHGSDVLFCALCGGGL